MLDQALGQPAGGAYAPSPPGAPELTSRVEEVPHPLSRRKPARALMLTSLFTLAYRVLRCAEAAGLEVHVLGGERSRPLGLSRACKSFTLNRIGIEAAPGSELAAEMNRQVQRLGIDIVLPGDAPTTRALAAVRHLVQAPCFPLPRLETFDLLNDKWAFTHLCAELGIPCPASWLVASRQELLERLNEGSIRLPAIAKPLSWDGGLGVLELGSFGPIKQAEQIDYAPILVQDFIPGEDIGASIYCQGGEIRAFIAHRLKRATYSTFHDEGILEALSRIAAHLALDGVYNFDMRLTPGGEIFYLECNPRFFFKINLSMAAGLNFVTAGLGDAGCPGTVAPGTHVRLPKAFAADLVRPWSLGRRDFEMLKLTFSDPIPYFSEILGAARDH